jgi:hypothetical protein
MLENGITCIVGATRRSHGHLPLSERIKAALS